MPEKLFWKYTFIGIGIFIFSLIINTILLKFSKNLGRRNINEELIRWSETSKPSLGGIAFYILFLFSYILYPMFFEATIFLSKKQIGLLLSVTMGFLMGLADDAYNTKPLPKFLTQVLCGIVLIYSGFSIKLFDSYIINYALTLIWVVGLMNSINMLDNMDAITTSVSLCIFLTTIVILAIFNQYDNFYFYISTVMFFTLLGFLYYNWHPSKLFMGDSGSQFLGVLLAAISIHTLWTPVHITENNIAISKYFLVPFFTFIIPIADTITVVINRLMRKTSPFVGGLDHTTHHLSYLGLTDQQVAFLFILVSLIASSIAIYIATYNDIWNHNQTFVFSLIGVLLIAALFITTKISNGQNNKYD